MRRLMLKLQRKEGQGMTEYIVIIGIVVAIAITVVKTGLITHLTTSLENIGQKVETETK